MSERGQGRRLLDGYHLRDSEPGDYWRQPYSEKGVDGERGTDWQWTIRDPDGRLGTLATHRVIEHDDGTITAEPSVLDPGDYESFAHGDDYVVIGAITDNEPGWHGFLERGVWRSV